MNTVGFDGDKHLFKLSYKSKAGKKYEFLPAELLNNPSTQVISPMKLMSKRRQNNSLYSLCVPTFLMLKNTFVIAIENMHVK